MLSKKAMTLIEVLTVVIIIGILAGVAVPRYFKTIERAKDQEAITNLKLIKAAQAIYFVENNTYCCTPVPFEDVGIINQTLHLNLPATSDWIYAITVVVSPPSIPNFRATATRNDATFSRFWRFGKLDIEPVCSGVNCP